MNGKISQIDALSKSLEVAEMRHKVVSQNLANVNTPNYHAVDLDFQQTLEAHLSDQKLTEDGVELFERPDLVLRADGNNVDVDLEVGDLNKNVMLYQTYTQLLSAKLGQMRTAIAGR
ncbi:MAG: flagellar basal body rod protein FlgB [Pirellulaceae bacterium]